MAHRLLWFVVLGLFFPGFAGTASVSTISVSGRQRAPLLGGAMYVQGNEWNSSAPLTVQSDGGPDWHITNSQINQSTVGAYPGLFVGLHGRFATQTDPFPLQLSAIAPGEVASDVTSVTPSTASSAKWVDFYDIFIEPNPTANPFSSTREELEIWQNAANRSLSGAPVAKGVTFDGQLYDVYDLNPGANTIAYVPEQFSDSFSGSLRPFFRDSVARGYAKANWYLVDVEHGFEIQNPDVVGIGDTRFGVRVGTRLIGR